MTELEQQTHRFRVALEWLKERADAMPETAPAASTSTEDRLRRHQKIADKSAVRDASSLRTSPAQR